MILCSRQLTYFSRSSLTRHFKRSFSSLVVSPDNMRKELDRSYYVLPNATPVCLLKCKQAFDGLTLKEKLYTHYMSHASWAGSLIVLLQTSPESPAIFLLLQKLFSQQSVTELRKIALDECGLSADEFTAWLIYACGVYANMGNYKGFGDTKIIPGVDKPKVRQLFVKSKAYANEQALIDELWCMCSDAMFTLDSHEQRLGFNTDGLTTYHSANVSKQDTQLVDEFMKSKKLEAWNTRLFKSVDKDGKVCYEIRLASVEPGIVAPPEDFKGSTFSVTRGDYGYLLTAVNRSLSQAQKHVANQEQASMIQEYVRHFTSGCLDEHKQASRHWIKDKGPAVETYIGFIENYRDPAGSRSEFEGFVAAVNREQSAKFELLVSKATEILPRLPWGAHYEKDKFLQPDFTSLDVICFGGSGIPAGINIPNYDEIRQSEGFKNVSLGNVVAAMPDVKIIFLSPEDQTVFKALHTQSFEVQVGLHELLGHGSGKLFQRDSEGVFNFDSEAVTHLLTGEKISTWYEPGDTWGAKFGRLSSAYEECRAEAVGYYLCCFDDVLKIFGHTGQQAADVKYANWLSELRAGLLSLEFYFPERQAWGQAHCHARYVLLQVCIEAGQGFVTIKEFTGDDGQPDLLFSIDRAKVDTVGKTAIYEFLKKLQVYKTTADVEGGTKLFEHYSVINEKILHWRDIVIARRQPRRVFVQCNTVVEGNDTNVVLKEYPETPEGLIQSNVDRYTDAETLKCLLDLAKKDLPHFQCRVTA